MRRTAQQLLVVVVVVAAAVVVVFVASLIVLKHVFSAVCRLVSNSCSHALCSPLHPRSSRLQLAA